MRNDPPLTICIVDDDQAVRDSLAWLVESVGLSARTFPDAPSFLAHPPPDDAGCLLLDVRMPGMSGLELQEELIRRGVGLPVIILTGHGDVPMAVRAMKQGALDFIEKPFNDQKLLDTVHRALALAREQRRREGSRQAAEQRLATLTPREREVMELVVAGKSNKEVATTLAISIKTVETHRARIMEKLEVDSLAALVRLSLAARLPPA